MKVIEKGADRTAEAHIYLAGQVTALQEYGQYVDRHDKAICCYVPVEEGQTIRIESRFSGLTLAVVHDILVDGVCRKTNSIVGKTVQVQKKKVPFETFLYEMSNGVIDTEMSVATHSGVVNLNKEARETVGTIELRVYVTRQFGIEHDINDIAKYDTVKDGADFDPRVATYKDIPPQFYMAFEKNCSALDARKLTAEKKKVYAKRPGTEPWVIFRFHYRTKESISDLNMDLTFDSTNKALVKKDAHPLDLEPVPILLLGSKPAGKNDGESSIRTSSPPPPETPSTPVKGSKNFKSTQPKVVKKQLDKHTPLDDSKSTPDTTFVDQTPIAVESEPIVSMSAHNDAQPDHSSFEDDLFARITTEDNYLESVGERAAGSVKEEDSNACAIVSKTLTQTITKKVPEPDRADADNTKVDVQTKALDEITNKTDDDLADGSPLTCPVEVANMSAVPHPADLLSIFGSTATFTATETAAAVLPSTKEFVKSGSKGFTSPLKKVVPRPAPVCTSTSMLFQKPAVVSSPATPVKRAPEGTLTPPTDLKRLKADAVPPLTPSYIARALSATPSPRTMSVEAQVAEQRQRLQATRKKRAEIAKKKAVLDERMLPYKQRMAEELERLKEEMAEEEAMMAEEENDFKASEAMLAEFERTDVDA